jgi:putative N6-adenine-specific DNA methylase
MSNLQLIATSAFGLEAVVARELHQLGYTDTKSFNGYVEFAGDASAIARTNLWIRSADRILIKMGEFEASTFDALFEQTKSLPWEDILDEDARFPVECRTVKSTLSSAPACQSIVKKAVVEALKRAYNIEVFSESGPVYGIEVALHNDRAVLTIDTSGEGLHKRGYRKLSALAPIKETLAAALVLLSRWQGHRPFADPLCGSGTIAIEAAMIGLNMAPGAKRTFAAEDWPLLFLDEWQEARTEAEDLMKRDINLEIFASDIDKQVLSLAEYHTRTAGVGNYVKLMQKDVAAFHPNLPYGCIVTNPPYGERLFDKNEVERLYRTMGKAFKKEETWSCFIITSHPLFEKLYGKRADKKRKLYNGRIQTNLYQYLGPLPPRRFNTLQSNDEQ